MVYRTLALAWTLAERDLRARYAQSALGWLWNLAQPVAMALILALIGQRMNQDLPAFTWLAGWVVWNAFSASWTLGSLSLAHNRELVTKTALPPLSYPLSKALLATVDGGIGLVLWAFWFFAQNQSLPAGADVFTVAVCLVLALLQGFGLGTLSALPTTRWKDWAVATPFMAQFAFLLSPLLAGSGGLPNTWAVWVPGWSALSLYVRANPLSPEWGGHWAAATAIGLGMAVLGGGVLVKWGKRASDWV